MAGFLSNMLPSLVFLLALDAGVVAIALGGGATATGRLIRFAKVSDSRSSDLVRLVVNALGGSSAATGLLVRSAGVSNSSSSDLALRSHSHELHQLLQSVASTLEPGATHDFLRSLHLCAPCTNFKRVGEPHDGGYVMCMDGLDKALEGALSFGVNGFDGWGMEVASTYHIPLNEYDCTSSKVPVACKGCNVHYHQHCILNDKGDAAASADAMKGIGDARAKDNEGEAATTSKIGASSFKTLTQLLEESGHGNAGDHSLLMKLDIEGAEWQLFAEEPVANLKKFREIVVEFHEVGKRAKHDLYLQAVTQLEDAGFAVAHMHGNDWGSSHGELVSFGKYSIPNVIEVTFVQKPAEGCATHLQYRLPMDAPNNPIGPVMKDAVLPDQ